MEPDFRQLRAPEDATNAILSLTYTVGAPIGFNLAISGIDGDTAQAVLNRVVDVLRTAEVCAKSIEHNKAGQLCLVVKGVLGNGLPLYGIRVGVHEPSLLIQLVYPDSNGHMPWDADYSMSCQKLPGGNLGVFPTSRHLCVIGYSGSQSFLPERIVLCDSDGSRLHIPSRHVHVVRVVS